MKNTSHTLGCKFGNESTFSRVEFTTASTITDARFAHFLTRVHWKNGSRLRIRTISCKPIRHGFVHVVFNELIDHSWQPREITHYTLVGDSWEMLSNHGENNTLRRTPVRATVLCNRLKVQSVGCRIVLYTRVVYSTAPAHVLLSMYVAFSLFHKTLNVLSRVGQEIFLGQCRGVTSWT